MNIFYYTFHYFIYLYKVFGGDWNRLEHSFMNNKFYILGFILIEYKKKCYAELGINGETG